MTRRAKAYISIVIFVVCSTMAACYLTPRNQASGDVFLPLIVMWSWLSFLGGLGVIPIALASRARRAAAVLFAAVICAAASLVFDYWILGIILRVDVTRVNAVVEILGNTLYVLVVLSSLVAPVALLIALFALRSKQLTSRESSDYTEKV